MTKLIVIQSHYYHQIKAQPPKQFIFCDNSHNSIIMLSLNTILLIIKINNNQTTQKWHT